MLFERNEIKNAAMAPIVLFGIGFEIPKHGEAADLRGPNYQFGIVDAHNHAAKITRAFGAGAAGYDQGLVFRQPKGLWGHH